MITTAIPLFESAEHLSKSDNKGKQENLDAAGVIESPSV